MRKITRAQVLSGCLAAGAVVGSMLGCNDDNPTGPNLAGTFEGQTWTVGNGTARTWLARDAAGKPTTLGVTLSETALAGLPEVPVEYSFELPPEAGTTPYRHVGLNWNPQGHFPPGVYDLPHFDVHFYTISEAQRYAIGGVAEDSLRLYRPPAPEYLGTGYFNPPGAAEARMGNHWVDPTAPEFGEPPVTFTRTFIYGTYDGQVTFWEPMVTKAYLETRPDASADIKLPQRYAQTGRYYPTRYGVHHDAAAREYRITLEAFVLR